MRGVHLDRRISPVLEDGKRITPEIATYLDAGCGFGGSCFPKDVKALIAHGQSAGEDMKILQSVIETNESQPLKLVELLKNHYASLKGRRVALLGLAFKPGTDDVRESPAIPVAQSLHAEGAELSAYDPVAIAEAQSVLGDIPIRYGESIGDAIDGVDAIVLVTAWEEFAQLPDLINEASPAPVLVDGRRIIDKCAVPKYEGIGLASSPTEG